MYVADPSSISGDLQLPKGRPDAPFHVSSPIRGEIGSELRVLLQS